MSSRTTARHRKATRALTPLDDFAPTARRGLAVAASSGLALTMIASGANAAGHSEVTSSGTIEASGVTPGVGIFAANAREAEHDPTAHAEIRALRAAGAALGDSHLDGCTLVVTLEPCTMCAGAIVLARVARLVLGAWEPRTGACGSVRDVVRDTRANHQVEVRAGLRAQESQDLLTAFFADRR